jgi:subtilisin-like proprotein convertase family protein
MIYRTQLILLGIVLLCAVTGKAQPWSIQDPARIQVKGSRDIIPLRYVVYSVDDALVRDILWTAPPESEESFSTSMALLTVGLADGSADIFRMVRYEMMEPELAAAYPDIRTFKGVSISNPRRTIQADVSSNGFRAVIRDEKGMMYIDPFQRNDKEHRIVYFRKDFQGHEEWVCHFDEVSGGFQSHSGQRLQGDCMFRSYRLALATTGEYSNYFGATSSAQSGLVMAQVVTAVNRVNDVYEADLTCRLILVANTNLVFYYNPTTDPYSNSNGSQMLGQNQTTLDGVIGNSNYDIGHVFSTGGGGVAYLNALCTNNIKAGGVTGLAAPVGDAFYIDYVAHEMGHQFGGDHTFNGTAGSCSGNRVSSSAYEPGSGSTIMAYAGICGAQDLQPHSDPYFHARSILQIDNHTTGTNCAAFITLNNTAPVAVSVADHTIPISTPFILTAQATDANGDSLSYCWEEYDLETTSSEPPASNDVDGPLFRSFNPTPSPDRYVPRLSDLVTNTNNMWEVLPSVTRNMTFRMTVRDYHNIAGCTDEDDIIVTANSTAGPFTVTSQNAPVTWQEGNLQTITWNVANTTAAPINCANVDIRLSYDGGFTYPGVLALNEPNDGSASVSIPIGTTNAGRVMVKASNNIFFDINNADIVIEQGLPNFTIALNPASVTECNDGSVQTQVIVGQYQGFSDPVTLSLLNPPPGSVVTFLPPVVIPGNNSILTISNLGSLFGTYSPTVRGSSTTGNKDVIFTINLQGIPNAPTLTSPANNAMNTQLTPLLDWSSVSGVTQYEVQLASDVNFNSIVLTDNPATDQYQVSTPLAQHTRYYWRVRGQNLCGTGNWSAVFSFTTASCVSVMSTNVPISIPSNGSPTVTSILNIPVTLTVGDVNVISLTGTHTYVDDLQFSLIAPNATEVLFWNRPCANDDNFNINFDDEAADSNWPCPPTNGLTYKPSSPLTPFDGLVSSGTWTLKIHDLFNQDGGSLSTWGLSVCGTCELEVSQASGSNPGSLPAALSCASNGDSIKLDASLTGQTINIGSSPLLISKNVIIVAEGPNISITTSGTRIFDIPTGVNVQLIGMILKAGTSLTAGAIRNGGDLTMENVTTMKNPGINGATLIQNTSGGQLLLKGACSLTQ